MHVENQIIEYLRHDLIRKGRVLSEINFRVERFREEMDGIRQLSHGTNSIETVFPLELAQLWTFKSPKAKMWYIASQAPIPCFRHAVFAANDSEGMLSKGLEIIQHGNEVGIVSGLSEEATIAHEMGARLKTYRMGVQTARDMHSFISSKRNKDETVLQDLLRLPSLTEIAVVENPFGHAMKTQDHSVVMAWVDHANQVINVSMLPYSFHTRDLEYPTRPPFSFSIPLLSFDEHFPEYIGKAERNIALDIIHIIRDWVKNTSLLNYWNTIEQKFGFSILELIATHRQNEPTQLRLFHVR